MRIRVRATVRVRVRVRGSTLKTTEAEARRISILKETWRCRGDVGRYGEMWGRCGEMWGDLGRYTAHLDADGVIGRIYE